MTYKKQDDVATYGSAHKTVENIIQGANLSSYSFSQSERVRKHTKLSKNITAKRISLSGIFQLDSK